MYDCRDFIETILIKEDFDDPKERARRAAQKRKEKEEAAKKAMAASKLVSFHFIYGLNLFKVSATWSYLLQSNKFTEEDIKILVKQFKMDFPTGKVNNKGYLYVYVEINCKLCNEPPHVQVEQRALTELIFVATVATSGHGIFFCCSNAFRKWGIYELPDE